MGFSVGLGDILDPLNLVSGAIDRKNLLPILSYLHCEVSKGLLTIVGSNQEQELSAQCSVSSDLEFEAEFTLPGRKLLEVCRHLSSDSPLEFELGDHVVGLRSGRFWSQFSILPVVDFPLSDPVVEDFRLELPVSGLRQLVEKVSFAMAQQDVRYFFNGMLFEVQNGTLRVVATNGQRLAVAQEEVVSTNGCRVILPRKAVLELLRLAKGEGTVVLSMDANHFVAEFSGRRLVTKLIDAEYPDYEKAIPKNQSVTLLANRSLLRAALIRISILSNELYRNVKLEISNGLLTLTANNPQQEEAEEEIEIEYSGVPIEIGFNVSYLTDVLSVVSSDEVEISLSDGASPIVISALDSRQAKYVISPMVI